MAVSTGPILTAGAITWANSVLLADRTEDLFTATARVGVGTGIAAMVLYGVEKISSDLAKALAWAAVVTVLFVRVPPNSRNPTPLERVFNFV